MTELDFTFQTICHRTIQAEKRLARHHELVAKLAAKGQPTTEVEASLGAVHAVLGALRAQRSDIARKLRFRARKWQLR
jgi:hypothetical protein